MVDHLSVEERSRNMAAIRSRDTVPELVLRRALRSIGLSGYRVGPKSVVGKPDITYTRWHLAVFVDGAYWHGHPDHFSPSRASDYWRRKIERNRQRDIRTTEMLTDQGWTVLRYWDFEVLRDALGVARQVGAQLQVLGRDTTSASASYGSEGIRIAE